MMTNYKKDFPLLAKTMRGKPLVYLDSSASSQKPSCVIDAMTHYYENDNANIHRGVYELSERATRAFEKTREHVKNFIHAKNAHEIIFTRGTTEGINLVAQSYGRSQLKEGDEILISAMEHHSNIVPWQLVAEDRGARVNVIPISDSGEIDLDAYRKRISAKTKIIAVSHASNVLGTINPIKDIAAIAHEHGIPVLVDGAQALPHLPVDVEALDVDFYAFSAHKAYGPTGVGVLYGKTELLEKMPPYQGGGDMIQTVSFEKSTYNTLPFKFEAGTPDIAGVIAFDAALSYLEKIGIDTIVRHEKELLDYATEKLLSIPEIKIIGTAKNKVGVISFVLKDIHPHDIATVLDQNGIAVRAGHHCAMPLMQRFNIPACTRASFGIYNTTDDIDALILGLKSVRELFGYV